MEQGLWTAIFSAGGPISGGGVVYLANGTIIGGDSQFYYTGTYSFDPSNNKLEARATVLPFVTGAIAVFGVQVPEFDLVLSGTLNAVEAVVYGFVPAVPSLKLNVKLVKRLDGKI